MSRRSTSRAAAALCAAALACAACGSGGGANGLASESAHQIMTSSLKAISAASSVHIAGSVVNSGQTATVNLTLFKNGDASGTFGVSGNTGNLVIVGNTVYFKGSAGFWKALSSVGGAGLPAASTTKLAGSWVALPQSSSASLGSFSLKGLTSTIKKGESSLKKVAGTKTVDGQSTVGVSEAAQGTFWIATSGTAYPVEVAKAASGGTEKLTFSNWDQGTRPSAPSGSKTLQQLLG